MGSAVQPAAWAGKIHSTEPGGREAGRPLRDPGEAVTTELALGRRDPMATSTQLSWRALTPRAGHVTGASRDFILLLLQKP